MSTSAAKRLLAALALFLLLSIPSLAAASENDAVNASITLCHNGLGDKADNPNAAGGWSVEEERSEFPTVCIYGSLASVSLDPLYIKVATISKLNVVVRTTGGPVDAWLQLAETLKGKIKRLVIDQACFSSCANYLVPLAENVVAGPNSLVVWHGGPSGGSTDLLKGTDVETAIRYEDLARRTQALYEAVGISSRILVTSSRDPSASKFRAIFGSDAREFSGYAFSPVRLSRCYGFKNLRNMWHAGDDKAVADLGRKRSAKLSILESPLRDRDGPIVCDK